MLNKMIPENLRFVVADSMNTTSDLYNICLLNIFLTQDS